jgi:hypothetical protein
MWRGNNGIPTSECALGLPSRAERDQRATCWSGDFVFLSVEVGSAGEAVGRHQ